MLRKVVLACTIAGCGYTPGSFSHGYGPLAPFDGERVTLGCLDLALARRADLAGDAVLQYRFGNRCNRPIEVDLQRVAVVARFGDGREVALSPHDPSSELRAARLAGRHAGREAIAYPTREPTAQVCVDAASIVRAEPAHWLCFAEPTELPITALEAP
jgi:hypothetical protein